MWRSYLRVLRKLREFLVFNGNHYDNRFECFFLRLFIPRQFFFIYAQRTYHLLFYFYIQELFF